MLAHLSLSRLELQEVVTFALASARPVLSIFESCRPVDLRPRAAVESAQAFAEGGERGNVLRRNAWAALKAAREAADAGDLAASEAAKAAAAAAAYLHPLAQAAQVKHILGSAAHAVLALELFEAPDQSVRLTVPSYLPSETLVNVLRRYPAAPPGGGRIGQLMRQLDRAIR